MTFCIIDADARIYDNARLLYCCVSESGRVYGNANLLGIHATQTSCVYGDASLEALAAGKKEFIVVLKGACKFGGSSSFKDVNTFEDFVNKYGADKVKYVKEYGKKKAKAVILTDVWDMG